MKTVNSIALQVIVINLAIIALSTVIVVALQNPLGLLGLTFLGQFPAVPSAEQDDLDDAEGELSEYDDTEIGFTGKLKK